MVKLFVRDFNSEQGYSEKEVPVNHDRSIVSEILVPWAVTKDYHNVIYARYGEHHGFNSLRGLIRYDSFVSQQRQRFCTSELGILALNSSSVKPAVNIVSRGVKEYLIKQMDITHGKIKDILYNDISHYFYTNGGMGYGRISQKSKNSISVEEMWRSIIYHLEHGFIEQQLSIHDAIGRKLLISSSPEKNRYDMWGHLVREKWFDDKEQRGRIESPLHRDKLVKPTTISGILFDPISGVSPVKQCRNRGVDMFIRDINRKRNFFADMYYDELDTHNLVFSAGISGTTGTLLQSAFTFGGFNDGELLKQYTLAIIAYLLGGGMHSYHEIMSIAKRVGVCYKQPGGFNWLPQTFVCTEDYKTWRDKYYDIVILGATHWRFNNGVLPSHLNKSLK
ncbi:hypothetical protein AAP54_10050 [Salmonella enterica subsp. enterica]|nr:hypothetical protein [Salmonella enterica subsp. enterica serovar Mikawasima]MIO70018.1 hypothetical protein [Salmonella enterica subsp. enterica serovar Mikawasima]